MGPVFDGVVMARLIFRVFPESRGLVTTTGHGESIEDEFFLWLFVGLSHCLCVCDWNEKEEKGDIEKRFKGRISWDIYS